MMEFNSKTLILRISQKHERILSAREKDSMKLRHDRQMRMLQDHFNERLVQLLDSKEKLYNKQTQMLESKEVQLQSSRLMIESLKLEHKEACRQMSRIHAHQIKTKNSKLKEAEELIAGMQEMFDEMVKEVHAATADAKSSKLSLKHAKAKAANAHARYLQHKLLADELNDEVCFADRASSEIESELQQSREMIDYLFGRLDEQQHDKSNWNPEVHRQGGWREDLNTLRESVQI